MFEPCRLRLRAFGAMGLTSLLALPLAALEIPYLSGRVNDLADLLSPESAQTLEERLAEHERATTQQVVVLTINSLEGEVLEDYSLRVAETWKLGQEGEDNGVLLLIARDDRKMRLEVGYGLEPVLTDLQSRRILDDVIKPRFREGDMEGGVEAGVGAILATLGGDAAAVDQLVSSSSTSDDLSDTPLVGRLFFFAFFLFIVGLFSLSAIATEGCGGWFLWAFLMPFWVLFPGALLAPVAALVCGLGWGLGFPLLRLLLRGKRRKRIFSRYPALKTLLETSRRSSRSSGGGWSSSGGGFSGGGGSFGGGGASSSW